VLCHSTIQPRQKGILILEIYEAKRMMQIVPTGWLVVQEILFGEMRFCKLVDLHGQFPF